MAKYANQRTVTINKEPVNKSQRNKIYLEVYCEDLEAAARNLGVGIPFALYIYLLSNKAGYELELSTQSFANKYGTTAVSARNAFKKLEEAGYITFEGNNHYNFYDTPQNKPQIAFTPTRYLVPQDDGTFKPMTKMEIMKELESQVSEADIDKWIDILEEVK